MSDKTKATTEQESKPENENLLQSEPESAVAPSEQPAQDVKENVDLDPNSNQNLRKDLDNLDSEHKQTLEQLAEIAQALGMNRMETMQALSDVQNWGNRIEGIVHNHNVRTNIVETMFCDPQVRTERKRLMNQAVNELLLEHGLITEEQAEAMDAKYPPLDLTEDLQRIGQEIVMPELKRKHEEAKKKFEEEQAKRKKEMEDAQGAAEEEQAAGRATIVGPDGQPLNTPPGEGQLVNIADRRPTTVMEED